MAEFKVLGQSRRVADGQNKITGAIRYAADMNIPGMLHARLVTSPYAHARILNIDVEAALATPGVVTVLTAKDLPDIAPTSRARLLLARDRTLFVGQPVALVLGTAESTTQDGADLVQVDYEPLPAAITMDEALADDAPLVWPGGVGESEEAGAHGADVGGQEQQAQTSGNVVAQPHFSRGDVEAGFAAADVIVEHTVTTPVVHQSYLEPQATIVQPDPFTGGATLWSSTQAPFNVREEVAAVLDVPESDVRVTATPLGGAFGGKFVTYQPLVALAARAAGRPVCLALTRIEEMLTGSPAQSMRLYVRLGARQDGTLTALEADITIDSGCFPASLGGLAALLLGSMYKVPNLSIRATEVLTFKSSATAYRAPTAPQAAFAIETLLNKLAQALDKDPLELRLQNAVEPGDPLAMGDPWPSIGMRQVLAALQDHPAWQQRDQARAAGRGVGIAVGGWPGGTEPAAAACALNRDGTLHVQLGSVDMGGTTAGFVLLAAEVFGIEPDKVRIIYGDTATSPYAGAAGGSKITYTVGPALIQAVREAREHTLAIAAEELEAAVEDLEIVDGRVQVRGVPDRNLPLGDIAAMTMQFGGKYAPVFGHGRYAETAHSPGFCAQLAEVEVDRDTGVVKVHRLVVVQDVGRKLNPAGIEGQMMGGATQGLGLALYENMTYDEHGQLLTASWMDYTVPHITQGALDFETVIVEVPADHGPFGARGVGEPPIIPTAAAVANAIADAVGTHPPDLPMTPPRVLAALQRE
jgi:CO/xanthine dehydrogenase Mo-binding subunit